MFRLCKSIDIKQKVNFALKRKAAIFITYSLGIRVINMKVALYLFVNHIFNLQSNLQDFCPHR